MYHLPRIAILLVVVDAMMLIPSFPQQWRDQHRKKQDERRRFDARLGMLQRVRQTWIEGVLEHSLDQKTRIALGLAQWPEAVHHGWRQRRRPGHEPELLPADTTVTKVFDDVGGRLLILGPPGSGKTTALLELTRDLLDRADHDAEQPIPVVFNLSSWAQRQRPLADWLIEELRHSYEMPRQVAQNWIDANAILPLLDGLDEVVEASRPACVAAINTFQDRYAGKLVVCSRTEQYENLVKCLRLENAVVLQPLTRQQIERYLEVIGDPVAGVREALKANSSLWEPLRSPLMLNVVTLAYQGRTAETLRAPNTAEQPEAQLFEAYTKRMFERWPITDRYTEARALDWLSGLAQSMRERSQSEFDLDRLQPDWLPTAQRRLVTLLPALMSALVGGLVGGLGAGLLVRQIPKAAPRSGLIMGLIFGLAFALVFALVALGGGRAYRPIESRRWSWAEARVMVLGIGLALGLVAGRVFNLGRGLGRGLVLLLAVVGARGAYELFCRDWEGAPTIEPVEPIYRSGLGPNVGLTSLRIVGLVTFGVVALRVVTEAVTSLGVKLGLPIWIGAVAVSELASDIAPRMAVGLAHKRVAPNEGIRRSARRGLAIGLVVWVAVGLIVGLGVWLGGLDWLGVKPGLSRSFGLVVGLLFGLVVWLEFGGIAFLRHVVLRGLLVLNRAVPRRYVRFLDDATERLFLHKGGGNYLFVHRCLLDHFAERPLSDQRGNVSRAA